MSTFNIPYEEAPDNDEQVPCILLSINYHILISSKYLILNYVWKYITNQLIKLQINRK